MVLVNFLNGETESAMMNAQKVPMFRDLKHKAPLVVVCATIIQTILFLMIMCLVFAKGFTLEFIPRFTTDTPCLEMTIPSTIFLALAGLMSMWVWEFTVRRKAAHLNIELGFHRFFRLTMLILVISLGLLNSAQCENLYILTVQMLFTFILFVVESTYHILLVIYLRNFKKFLGRQRKQYVKFSNSADYNKTNTNFIAQPTVSEDDFRNLNVEFI